MKKLVMAMVMAACAFSTTSQAQSADPKLEWATRLVALQQGPDLDNLVEQLAGSATQDLIAGWESRLEASVPAAQQAKATEDLNAELAKFAADASKIIGAKVSQSSKEALVPAYMERFTLDELKQLTAFFESPAVKKYKATAPDLVNVFVQKLVQTSRNDIQARAKKFDEVAARIVGASSTAPAAPAAKPAKK